MKKKYSDDGTYRNERVYRIFHNMKSRCYLPSFTTFSQYGGRGIKICDEWIKKGGFNNFYNWAMQNGYSDDLEIDRIDCNRNYEPSNCRWITRKEQNNNTRKNHYITYKGITKTASQWAEKYNIQRNVFNKRIRRGWSFEDAVSKRVRKYKSYKIGV